METSIKSIKVHKFLKNLDELFRIILDGRSNYEIWWIYISKEGRDEYFKVFLHYKEYFETSAYAHISMAAISLYKLFETRDDTVNFKNIINDALVLKIIDAVDTQKLNPTIEKAKTIWIKINQLRSYLFAHRAKELTVEEIYNNANLTPDQIKELAELSLEILNYIAKRAKQKERQFESFTLRDTYRLLKTLRNSYNKSEAL